jgi:UPF0716 protein FxsA
LFKILFILFLIVPLVEITILIEIGKVVGAAYTIMLVIGTAVLGAALLRQQGLSTLLPATELIEGLMLLVAGALLLTPGFFTDIFGFLVLIPALRHHIAQTFLINFIQSRINTQKTDSGNIIEGEHWESDSK